MASRLLLASLVTVLGALVGCSPQEPGAGGVSAPEAEREPSSEELDRLALVRFELYRTGAVQVDCDVLSDAPAIRLQGWVDTVDHQAYGLVTSNGVAPFLAAWTPESVELQAAEVTVPPLPVPVDGWEELPLQADASVLAAAQLMLVGLASDRPENPQILAQSGVRWLRSGEVDGVGADVFSGPVPEGASSSSFRYWVDAEGDLLRVEACLTGTSWSRFDVTAAPEIDLARG